MNTLLLRAIERAEFAVSKSGKARYVYELPSGDFYVTDTRDLTARLARVVDPASI